MLDSSGKHFANTSLGAEVFNELQNNLYTLFVTKVLKSEATMTSLS